MQKASLDVPPADRALDVAAPHVSPTTQADSSEGPAGVVTSETESVDLLLSPLLAVPAVPTAVDASVDSVVSENFSHGGEIVCPRVQKGRR